MSYEDGGMPAGGNSRFRGYPARMSERQQLALILQMTSQEVTSGPSNRSDNIPVSNTRSSPLHQKGSKSRWANKNADILEVNTSYNRQDDRLRIVNGCDSKERNEFAGSNSPEAEEVRTASGAESPVAAGSPAECAATVVVGGEQEQPRSEQPPAAAAAARSQQLEEPPPTYEMRRTPPQNKVDRQASGGQQQQQQQQQQQPQSQQQQQSSSSGSAAAGSGAGGGSSGGRVTLRLNQVRATRDEKKGAAAQTGSNSSAAAAQANANARQANASASLSSNQMESTTGKSSSGNASTTAANAISSSGQIVTIGIGGCCPGTAVLHISCSTSSADGGDVYEFKSSKEATPVRGSSTSPNPNPNDKDAKESATSSSMSSTAAGAQNQTGSGANAGSGGNVNAGSAGAVGSSTTNSSAVATSTSSGATVGSSSSSSMGASGGAVSTEALSSSATSATTDEPMITTASPSSSTSATSTIATKRAFEGEGGQADEQDEEGRKRKKKDTESGKEATGAKGAAGRGQAAGRNNAGAAEKCSKSGKQAASAMSTKGGQGSPSSTLNANSPKPSSSSGAGANNPKGNTPSIESDGEDERSKNSDCNSAPKVPPLKIVIPQSTTSEQEQGNRNGKNTSNRSHQLPYVVASSNSSSDSMDKEQSTSAVTSGTTSPLDGAGGTASKSDEKKDFSGALDNESRSTHHQRVLRSSHRSGNGGNGNSGPRDSSASASGNGSYSNSSPLPSNAVDRSNNSSPQQRHNSPTPETGAASEAGKSTSTDSPMQSSPAMKAGGSVDKCEKGVDIKKEPGDTSDGNSKKDSGNDVPNTSSQASVDLHPRKRKMKTSKEAQHYVATTSTNETTETTSTGPEVHPHEQPITNCFQEYLNLRKQIHRKRKSLFPVQPKPPQGFKDYLMNRCTYVLEGNANKEPTINPPVNMPASMKDLYTEQEKERYQLRMQHVVEKEKLVLSVEQEILRVHGRAARALANQALPFSVCTFLKDEEVYNVITPEQEEKDRNARSRYNGRLFLSWLQDVDDKWEKIKEAMLLRHHNEAESLNAVQRLNWGFKLEEVGLCETKSTHHIEELHVPIVHVSDDFDLLPA